MGLFNLEKLFGMTIRESATDGSDFTNPDADYRRLFLGEDGSLHLKDSAGTVTNVAGAGGSDLVQTWSGGGSVYISGLAGSPDIRVAATNDNEFETTDVADPMTGWTTLGAPTAHDMNSTAKSHYYVSKSATAGPGQHGIYKANPSTPFTVTCKLSDVTLTGDDNGAGLFVGESTPGKMLLLSVNFNSGVASRRKLLHQIWTNPTTYSSTVATTEGTLEAPIYLRLVVTSSTNISAYYSANGYVWRLAASATNPSFTVGSVGLMMLQNNASFDMAAIFDWIRFT
jgi:hypothetical protein